ncbi:hypothetical protein LOTGIDRAFT_172762 [Lottia gigantea]|uniref:Protein kinase domain-containing protein n=1 Tax=Lottia gigantea TaxID=225164 RepID=V4AV07_LOTGI|nr:hypothetical protein LOTGIDRAFT_172762 [Lottia gigantea]ESP01133.1 hypothetical protein LOTGIDRAFT_172762 [Lottia gigantea]
MKKSDGFQPSLIQQNLQCFSSLRLKALKVMQSNALTRSTISGYSSNLLQNTHQYRIINNTGSGDIPAISQITDCLIPLTKLRTAVEYLDTPTQMTGRVSVSTETQTISSELVEAATQTLSKYSEAATQTSYNWIPTATEVSATTISTSIQTSSTANSMKTSLSDAPDASGPKSPDSGLHAFSVNSTSTQQQISEDKIMVNFQKFKDALDSMHESLKTSIEQLKQDVDRFANSRSIEYIRSSSDLFDPVNIKYNTPLDTEDWYSAKDDFYSTSTNNYSYDKSNADTPEYFYSITDSSTDLSATSSYQTLGSYDNGKLEYFSHGRSEYFSCSSPHVTTSSNDDEKSEYFSFKSPYVSTTSYAHYYSFDSDYDSSSNQQFLSPTDANEHSISLQQNRDIISSHHTSVDVHYANSSNNDTSSCEHDTINNEDYSSFEKEFDIRNLVTINSFGHFSLDNSTMLSMFGFDPRNSPFVPCGYIDIGHLPETLNSIVLQDIKRSDIRYEINDDNSYNEIGRGSFGVVYLASMKNIKNKVVIKEFHHHGVSWEDIEREAQILSYLKGQDITPNFLGVLTPRKKSRNYSLVQEYYGHGNVEDIYLEYDLPPDAWIIICKNICKSLFQIHCNHILFNDLKSDNILVDLNTLDIRFIDFGMATFRKGMRFEGCSGSLGEYLFYAPEVREGCFSTPQSDIYSLGFLFKQIIKRANVYQLFPLYNSCTQIQAIYRPTLPEIMEILDTL